MPSTPANTIRPIRKVVVTGAAGKVGRATVSALAEAGYDVVATDRFPRPDWMPGAYLQADLTDLGETTEVLAGADAVAHIANIPAPRLRPEVATLTENVTMNANVFFAAARLGLARVVWASSETTLGLDFSAENPPRYLPVDEAHFPYPTTSYASSKVLTEELAAHVSGWSGIPFIGLRLSNVFVNYEGREAFDADPVSRIWNVWGYIDVRDAAAAFRAALEAPVTGSVNVIIANDDTIMQIPTAQLASRFFPDVELRAEVAEFGTLLANGRAKELLGWRPTHGWR